MNSKFTKTDRLVHQSDFDRVYESDLFAADHVLVIKGTRTSGPRTRLGLSVSRRVGNAVVRNRWKRAIREAFRTRRAQLPPGFDFIVRPRRGAEPHLASIVASLPTLARRIARRIEGGQT